MGIRFCGCLFLVSLQDGLPEHFYPLNDHVLCGSILNCGVDFGRCYAIDHVLALCYFSKSGVLTIKEI